jgi:DNA-binding HxlR family transcriptional regulator
MRSYRQYCGLAKALDVVGDRWTLLIVRELLVRGGCRYTDLQAGLPGIATNLLAQRLVALEQAGIVRREAAPPPVATTVVQLTPRGAELAPAIAALGRWAGPLLSSRGRGETFRPHWLALPLQLYLTDKYPTRPPVTLELRAGDEPVTVETIDGGVRARPGPAASTHAVLTGAPELILGVLMGRIDLARARSAGLKYEGDPATLRRLQPRVRSAHTSSKGMNP